MSDDTMWPNDVDGDVFRNLQENGFDFSKEYVVDFNVDFESWPPAVDLSADMKKAFPGAVVERIDDDEYIVVKIKTRLTYEFVVFAQKKLSDIAQIHGGYCESWGVMH